MKQLVAGERFAFTEPEIEVKYESVPDPPYNTSCKVTIITKHQLL
jgi:hypothetical protein